MRTHRIAAALFTALCLALAGCGQQPQTPTERTTRVCALTVTPDSTVLTHEYVGTLEEESGIVLSFPVPGTVRSVEVREGEHVTSGALLATLDAINLRSTDQAAQATLRQAQDAMNRLQQLYDKGSLPEIQYIEAQTKLAQARATAEIAAQNLNDSRLTAPCAGVIGRRAVEAGENIAPGQPVLTLLDTHTVLAKIAVPEREIADLKIGDRATIRVAALGDRTFRGIITEKGVEGDPLSHTYAVRIRLNNSDGSLLPGMVCNAAIQRADEPQLIILPARAIQLSHTGEHFVWTITDEGRAARTAVTVGALTERGVEIRSGLHPGDRVITEGTQKIGNGSKVETL